MADILSALLLLAAAPTSAAPSFAAIAAGAPACTGASCAADRCDAATCSSSLSFSAMHKPGGVHAPASSLEVMSWSWGASNAVPSPRDAADGMASGKRSSTGMGSGKASMSDLSVMRSAPSSSPDAPSSVSSVSNLAGGSAPAAQASYARSSPPACAVSSGACPGTVSVQLSSSRKGWDGCVKGSHIPSAHLRGAASDLHLRDVTIEDCDDASSRMTLRYAAVSEAPPAPSSR